MTSTICKIISENFEAPARASHAAGVCLKRGRGTSKFLWRVHLVHSYQIVIGDYPIVNYNFELIRMRKYRWQDFLERAKTNPLAAAYLPLTDYPAAKRPWILAHSLRLIAAKVKNRLKRATLLSLAERSIRLNDNEKKEFKEIISSDPQFQEVGMLQSVEEMYQEKWEEIGFEKGIEQGTLNTIRSFLDSGVSWEVITKATGMTREDFEKMHA